MRRAALLVALALPPLAAGCAGMPRLGHGDQAPAYGPSFVDYAGRIGTIPLVVHGNPFGLSPAETGQALAAATRLPGWFAGRPFQARPDDAAARQDYRVVLIANPTRPLAQEEPCGDLGRVPVAGRQCQT